MKHSPRPEAITNPAAQGSSLPTHHNPYAKMSQRRAIACTICAKAKTKCDKAVSQQRETIASAALANTFNLKVPSCSRCTAKGLQCEPRSTRRTSDSTYARNTKKPIVSPKRYPSSSTTSRHGSPRSVPTVNRHQLVRAVSQMDMATVSKLGHQRPEFSSIPMLTPLQLQSYTPHIMDECYSDHYSSPEPNMGVFPHQVDKNSFTHSGRLTPQTPEPFRYSEPLSIADPFDQYMNSQAWSEDGQMPIGLGFENDIPGLMPGGPDMRMWTPELDASTTPMAHGSQALADVWPTTVSAPSPPQLPHTRAVPSLSLSECSVPDFDSPNAAQEEWTNFRSHASDMAMPKPTTSISYVDSLKAIPRPTQAWEDGFLSRSSTF